MTNFTQIDEVVAAWAAILISAHSGQAASYRFSVDGAGGGSWVLDLARSALERSDRPADCTIELSSATMLAIANQRLNPQRAYLEGNLRFSGNPELGFNLSALL